MQDHGRRSFIPKSPTHLAVRRLAAIGRPPSYLPGWTVNHALPHMPGRLSGRPPDTPEDCRKTRISIECEVTTALAWIGTNTTHPAQGYSAVHPYGLNMNVWGECWTNVQAHLGLSLLGSGASTPNRP